MVIRLTRKQNEENEKKKYEKMIEKNTKITTLVSRKTEFSKNLGVLLPQYYLL